MHDIGQLVSLSLALSLLSGLAASHSIDVAELALKSRLNFPLQLCTSRPPNTNQQ
jgi:hypothetical protein